MPDRLYSLAYLSRLQVPDSRAALRAGILDILAVSRANNLRLGITGVLLFCRAGFAQVLEGNNTAIQRVFGAIRQDSRHRDVTLLNEQAISERSFGEWAMAYVEPPDDRGDALDLRGAGVVTLERVGTSLEAQRIIGSLRAQMAVMLCGRSADRMPEELSGL